MTAMLEYAIHKDTQAGQAPLPRILGAMRDVGSAEETHNI